MICLGIESTAHTLGVGVVDGEEVLANQRSMYEPGEGGIHPRKAAEHHYAEALDVYHNALSDSDISEEDIDVISFSRGPGMPPCLDIGAVIARSLSLKLDVPLHGVNHVIAHIEIGRLAGEVEDPVVLFLSGGNSQVISFAGSRYRVFGETLDIALGNALDKLARSMGFPHPGGPEIERLAREGEELLDLSYVVKGMDFSFSGIVTEAQRLLDEHSKEDVALSFQEHGFAMVCESTERALSHLEKDEVLLTGGVAANERLRGMVETMCEERGDRASLVPREYAMDNGAMIAWLGILQARGESPTELADTDILPDWRPEEVEVTWRD